MKNLLIATTALVATAGMASAEVTFSGKGEAGMYQTGKTKAVAAVAGVKTTASAASATNTQIVLSAAGVITTTKATGVATGTVVTAGERVTARLALSNAQAAVEAAKVLVQNATTHALVDTANTAVALAAKNLLIAEMTLSSVLGSAKVAAKAGGDMVAYSGYDMNVAVSAETDSGIVFGMGFDMGAGLIADQNDDRAMDAQGAVIGTSALSATMSGYTLKIGSDKIDDVYDDTQNGDIALSGNVGGIAFNLVHDLTDEVVAKAATYTAAKTVRVAHATNFQNLDGSLDTSTTIAAGDSDYKASSYSSAVAATVETTSLSLGGAAGAVSYSFAMTTGNDSGDSAAKGSLTYTGMENLSLTLAHNNAGKLDGISKITAKYTMGSLTATLSMADDKDHAGNTNDGKKASNNLSLAYAANGLAATFATDESSQWWVNTQYDLGGGAQAFATIDHTEFAVVGLNFNF